jgi:di/tricarboxylate transporter
LIGARFKLTPLGIVLLLIFVAAVVMALIGSATEQAIGLVAVVFLALFALGGAPLGRSGRAAMSTLAARSGAVTEHHVLAEAPPDAEAWQRERERRERAQASPTQPSPVGDDPVSGRD